MNRFVNYRLITRRLKFQALFFAVIIQFLQSKPIIMNLNLEQHLNAHYLFSPLSAEAKKEVARHSRIRNYHAQNLIFTKNEPTQDFFIVVSGSVRLFFSTPDGKEKTIKIFRPPQSFGEALMFMRRETYPAHAMAMEDNTTLIAINSKSFLDLLLQNPDSSLLVMASLSEHVHTLTQQVEMLSVFDARTRLLNYLNRQLPPMPKNNVSYPLSLNKKQIAEYLAIRPETLSRILKQLEQEEIFIWQGQNIHLLNWSPLDDV